MSMRHAREDISGAFNEWTASLGNHLTAIIWRLHTPEKDYRGCSVMCGGKA